MNKSIFQIVALLICFFLLNCKKKLGKSNPQELEKSFERAVNDYISKNPLNLPIPNRLYDNGFSYPSYHIFFNHDSKDTLMSIVQFPHFSDIKLEGFKSEEDEITYETQKEKGFIIYKEKYPLVIFDEKNVGGKYYNNIQLTKVPDSLKFNEENYHIDFIKWDFQSENGKLKRVN